MTRRKYGILAGILGAVGAWWWTRQRSGWHDQPLSERGTTIFHNAPEPPPMSGQAM